MSVRNNVHAYAFSKKIRREVKNNKRQFLENRQTSDRPDVVTRNVVVDEELKRDRPKCEKSLNFKKHSFKNLCNIEVTMTKVTRTVPVFKMSTIVLTVTLAMLLSDVDAVVTPISPQMSFLPGIGEFLTPTINEDGIRIPRSQTSSSSSDSDNLDNPFLAPSGTYNIDEPLITRTTGGRALEQFKPAMDAGDGKCSYVQMKGGPIPRAECQPGGMACSKDCSYGKGSKSGDDGDAGDADGDGSNCVTVTERMCGDVPKEECETVNEKVCEQVPEELCDDGYKGNDEPETDTK